jgi:hypothetical protein
MAKGLEKVKDEHAMYYNHRHEPAPIFAPGDRVWLDGSDMPPIDHPRNCPTVTWAPLQSRLVLVSEPTV